MSLSVGAKKTYAAFPRSGTDKVTLGGGPYYLTEESSFTMPKPPSGVEKKYYFEIVMTKGDGLIGITTVNSSGQSNYYAGLDTEGSRFFSYVNLADWRMGAGYNPGVAYRLGDTVSVLITQKYNETKAEFWSNCLKVGEISRSPYSVRPAVQIRYEAEVIANFGNRPFVCNVPDGYQPGLWSEQ